MSVSGRVDSGNESDAKICTPHDVWFTYTFTRVCLIITPPLAFPHAEQTGPTLTKQKLRSSTKRLPKSGFEKVPKGSPFYLRRVVFFSNSPRDEIV